VSEPALHLRIQDAIRSDAQHGRDVERIGPFLATFTPGSRNPYLNYAIPERDAAPSRADVEALAEAFERRSLRPRLEYVPSTAPDVEASLLDAGFTVEARTPLMTFGGTAPLDSPDGIELLEAREAETIRAAASVQSEAYGEAEPPGEGRVAGLQRGIERGALLVLARDRLTGEPAGAGQCTVPVAGATELTSVGVRAAFRRRGIAQAVAARLATTMSARGADLVFLMADGEPEARIYGRAGFARAGEVLHVSRERAAVTPSRETTRSRAA
jgi:ribosomal protein S18 acetylase RimI-like enzyme